MMEAGIDGGVAMTIDEVRCPYCGEVVDLCDLPELVTYWGEGGPLDVECIKCELMFWVQEGVSRSWEVSKENLDE